MATCNPTIDSFIAKDGSIEVSEKYLQLMKDSLDDESLYIRTKDTILSLFDDLQLTEIQKAEIVAGHMAQFGTSLSATAMQTALAWGKEERDGNYTLAKLQADTEVALAQFEKVKSEICALDKETELKCAQVTATTAGSIRDNGTVATYGADGCSVTALNDNGLKYEQTQQVKGATYQIFADAFRKSGVVQIGTDVADSVYKGLSGDGDGYTWQQQTNAERLRIGYEDSKRNHAANSSASMIGQMLSAEIAPSEADIDRWRTALDWLNTSHSTTSNI